jgi:hypothetical protein
MATQLHTEIIPDCHGTVMPAPYLVPDLPKPSAQLPRKKLIRRADHDFSQHLRHSFQLVFLLLNLWIGIRFYHWVQYYETQGRTGSRNPACGCGRLAANRRHDEFQVLVVDRPGAVAASRGDVSPDYVRGDRIPISQSVLQLAVSGGDGFRMLMASRS